MTEKQLAFPCLETDSTGNPLKEHLGLTKREYFVGLCLQGILANSSINNMDLSPTKSMTDALKVEFSIRMADELLKQLDNEPTTNLSYL